MSLSPQTLALLGERSPDLVTEFLLHELAWEASEFEMAEALYWLAADYGGSEHDPLRRAANSTGYEPGPFHREPSTEVAFLIYQACGRLLA